MDGVAAGAETVNPLWAPWRMQYLTGDARENFCIFCPEGRTSPWVIHAGRTAQVVMNRFPYANGHTLISPLRHVSMYEELGEEEIVEIGALTARVIRVLKKLLQPRGFNLGWNIGAAAGAGIADHLHQHIVPRWDGDTNFMPVLADVRVIPEHLETTVTRFRAMFMEEI